MKSVLLVFILGVVLVSCERDMLTHHLNTGLEELEHSRPINEKLVSNYEIKKLGFFNLGHNKYKMALLLNDNIEPEMVEAYTLGMHIKSDSLQLLPKGKNYISLDTTVTLKTFNNHNYIIREFKTPIKQITSLRIFLYNLGVYKKREGNQVVIRNIGL
ncbi:hypothetical protein ES677_04705 [Bizionia gelidisalsuginis]|uniref:Lipoprotein n=1 Tax=Bizionia gelidisalsuginis TaxID=291188 RepID=A0ABY3MCM1_9FLAO|nr:hypothetical protein [Bizionia gelidisalsuginis]TYC15646.1 hypothetical protein ES677_04705 [Bizionia gelidisalsuginis]